MNPSVNAISTELLSLRDMVSVVAVAFYRATVLTEHGVAVGVASYQAYIPAGHGVAPFGA